MNPHLLLLFTIAASACGPAPGATDSASGSSSSGMTEGTGGGTTSTATGATDPSSPTGEPGSTGMTGMTSTTGADPTGGPTCADPDSEPVIALWSVSFPNDDGEQIISATCAVTQVEQMDTNSQLTLACKLDFELVVQLTLERRPVQLLPFQVGDLLQFEYRADPIFFWANQWFSIRDAANPTLMILGGISADHVPPPDASVQDFYFVDIDVVSDECPLVDPEPCSPLERLALDLDFEGVQRRVFDAQFATLVNLSGDYTIWLDTAHRPTDPSQCDDFPPAWFQALMALDPGP